MFVHSRSVEDLPAEVDQDAVSRVEPQPVADGDHRSSETLGTSENGLQALRAEENIIEAPKESSWAESRTKEEDICSDGWRDHRKHVFVLSEAGKPIYSRYGTEEALSSTMGVMMALVSVVEADKNIIRSIHGGSQTRSRISSFYLDLFH